MTIVEVALDTIEFRLQNGIIGTPAKVRLAPGSVEVEMVGGDRVYQFEFALVGPKIRLIAREMSSVGVTLSVIEIYDYANEPADNALLRLTGIRDQIAKAEATEAKLPINKGEAQP